MKKLILISVICLISSISFAASHQKMMGTWSLNTPTAPYGYTDSELTISVKDGVEKASIYFESVGETLNLDDLELTDTSGKGVIQVEYQDYDVSFNIKDSKIEGKAKGWEGTFEFTGNKKKQKN